ncbi:MAG: DUF4157 domain-containing protein [Moorea sp. SIO3F7]|nr:DUF4157 domain-containing protein [Moorena sp. SIO3E8]NEQ04209.1 DUF4157 domain-containing protein [Moorena sp. SIO3F7]
MSANVMRTLESGEYQPETGRREIGLQPKLRIGQPGDRSRQGENHGGHQVVQPKRMMVQRAAQPLTGDSVTYGDSMRASRREKENKTGLPDRLKGGIENLSGYSMDDVRVHYNSVKPAQLQALAYAQGTEIHVGPGQEKHLPHEAWHVVQQKQGRVKPTKHANGVAYNDDRAKEKEAEKMGEMATSTKKQIVYKGDTTHWECSHEFQSGIDKKPVQGLVQLVKINSWKRFQPIESEAIENQRITYYRSVVTAVESGKHSVILIEMWDERRAKPVNYFIDLIAEKESWHDRVSPLIRIKSDYDSLAINLKGNRIRSWEVSTRAAYKIIDKAREYERNSEIYEYAIRGRTRTGWDDSINCTSFAKGLLWRGGIYYDLPWFISLPSDLVEEPGKLERGVKGLGVRDRRGESG